MNPEICIFEPRDYHKLLPLVWFRPVFELRCGIVTLRDKIETAYDPLRVSVHCRSYLAQVLKEHNIVLVGRSPSHTLTQA